MSISYFDDLGGLFLHFGWLSLLKSLYLITVIWKLEIQIFKFPFEIEIHKFTFQA